MPKERKSWIHMGIVMVAFSFGTLQAQSSSPAPAPALPFPEYADEFIGRHGMADLPASFQELLESGYVCAELGIFDAWFPMIAFDDRRSAGALEEASTALLDVQERWFEWVGEEELRKQVQKDAGQVAKWVRSWKPGALSGMKIIEGEHADIAALMGAKKTVLLASRRFRDVMREGGDLGRAVENSEAISVVFSPDRQDFLGLGSFLGTLNNMNRRTLWQNGLAMWTSYKRGGMHVLALEHPATWPGRGDVSEGMDMNSREKTGLKQHVAQHAMDYLLAHRFGDTLPPDIMKGLSINMVIELYKENNVRAGGGRKGRKTEAYTQFVAGGNSNGGRLAARNADNHWRHTKGKDFFLGELRAAQKSGARKAKKEHGKRRDKLAFFLLSSDSGTEDPILARAPFFMDTVGGSVPGTHGDEWLEFRRAYCSAFVHWLQNQVEGKRNSREAFRRLLRAVEGSPMDQAVETIYSVPLTALDGTQDSLEWRFLAWLAKRK